MMKHPAWRQMYRHMGSRSRGSGALARVCGLTFGDFGVGEADPAQRWRRSALRRWAAKALVDDLDPGATPHDDLTRPWSPPGQDLRSSSSRASSSSTIEGSSLVKTGFGGASGVPGGGSGVDAQTACASPYAPVVIGYGGPSSRSVTSSIRGATDQAPVPPSSSCTCCEGC